MELYDHQKKLLADNPKKTLLCWDTGTGKTLGSLALAYQNTNDLLIICPKGLKKKWERDADNFLREFHPTGRRPKILSKEDFRRDARKLAAYKAMIFDEGHYFAGMKSQMHKAALWYIQQHKPEVIIIPTATPYMSTPWNIFALGKLLGHNWSWIRFKSMFFEERWLGNRTIPVVKKGIEKDIAAIVNSIGSTVRIDECGDVPEQVFDTEVFALTKAQQKAKEEVKKIESNPVVKFTKYHQIDNGTLRGNEYEPHLFIEADKHDRILDMANEHQKLAVVCRYNLQIDYLKDKLVAAGHNVFIIRGDTKDRDTVVLMAEAAEKGVVLINASCSEGYELPSFGVIVFASLSFSYKDYKQICGRFLRGNALKKNVYVHLITLDSVDEAVFASIMRKQDFSLAIYAREQGEVVSLEDAEIGGQISDEILSLP